MRIAVITRHAISNYGSLLQALATQIALQDMGHEVNMIDYVREDEEYRNYEKTMLSKKAKWSKSIFRRFVYLCIRQPESISAGKKFEKMRKKYLRMTQRYRTKQELSDNTPKADIYMTGSDQVWGAVADGNLDGVYFLDFVASSNKKIAYAASFGKTQIQDNDISDLRKWLKEYTHIAVRESNAVELLRQMDIPSSQVLDPTLLLDQSEWTRLTEEFQEKNKKKYILVYQIHNSKELNEYAKKVSQKTGLPLIRISPYFHQFNRGGSFKWKPDLGRFLSYIQNATYLVTDSFHGTAFAINFNVDFIEILPTNKTESRNKSILSLFGLSDRIINDMEDYSILNRKIDYKSVNTILDCERKKSLEILQKMINE